MRDAPTYVPSYPPELPITEWRERIVSAIKGNQVIVITGETGSGKSTQIPKFCLEAGRGQAGMIGCTQPRRIAAITISARVSEELKDRGPQWVGYKIRFQDRTARSTRIKFMTDGIVLAEAQRDRLFRAYDTIIVDEAHERSLNIDFLLGLLKRALPRRPDLKVIITSATIDPERFSQAFGGAPVFEVSGRTWPVEVRYRPIDSENGESEDVSYIGQAVEAADMLKGRRTARETGDILVFMPTESDIRETVQRLEEKRYFHTLVYPLFGRMAASDQQRIFAQTTEEKIIVATNVAETSITIPRIRYVIDTGLARISQYNARSRTQSLPVAPVSRASADQRMGRCGRVEAGVCIRLYSEEDYLSRPLYTLPEILRANLAEVILRMLYLRLGNVQEFPFLDPPSAAAIKDGFAVLKELGALDENLQLTPAGQTMARLPLDPRLSRMLIEARRENGVREMTILAAALSIQDPRERPLEQEAQADRAHAAFKDPRSDFVWLLKVWQASWGDAAAAAPAQGMPRTRPSIPQGERGSQGERYSETDAAATPAGSPPFRRSMGSVKKFCRENFLSFRRMREWRDVCDEIRSILSEMGDFPENPAPASFEAIHRSVLSGYLSHIALRKDKNIYTAARNRQAMIFPGSGLFGKGGAWIVASEMVQTTRLYARTAATILPEWIEELGRHLCRYSYSEPHWERARGQVAAYERVVLYGLPVVERRKVNYGRINPEEAREIFIRSALVEGDLPPRYGFLEHNRELLRKIEELESRTRRRDLFAGEEALYDFYSLRLPALADLRSFDKFLKDQGGDSFLRMTEEDLLRAEPDRDVLAQFPGSIEAGGNELPLRYAFHPEEEYDGVTAVLPVHALAALEPGPFEWMVPGLVPEKVLLLLKSLPKSIRKRLVPVNEAARALSEALASGRGDFYSELSRKATELAGMRILPGDWDRAGLPVHLKMRFEIVGPEGNVLGAGRDLEELKPLAGGRHDDRLWEQARKTWEKEGLGSWSFGDLPESVAIGKDSLGLTRYAWPGLSAEGEAVAVRLFSSPGEAKERTRAGLLLLYQLVFSTELKQLRKDWAFTGDLAGKTFFMGNPARASAVLHDYILRELFGLHRPQSADRVRFEETVRGLKGRLGLLSGEILAAVHRAAAEREITRSVIARFRQMARNNGAVLERLGLISREMEALMGPDFLDRFQGEQVRQLPRCLRALAIRAERAYAAPEKDKAKAQQAAPYETSLLRMQEEARSRAGGGAVEQQEFLDEFMLMVEEFKISLFAPEVKTKMVVSKKRLDSKLEEWQRWKGN